MKGRVHDVGLKCTIRSYREKFDLTHVSVLPTIQFFFLNSNLPVSATSNLDQLLPLLLQR